MKMEMFDKLLTGNALLNRYGKMHRFVEIDKHMYVFGCVSDESVIKLDLLDITYIPDSCVIVANAEGNRGCVKSFSPMGTLCCELIKHGFNIRYAIEVFEHLDNHDIYFDSKLCVEKVNGGYEVVVF